MTSLEGWGSAIELRPRVRRRGSRADAHRQRTGTAQGRRCDGVGHGSSLAARQASGLGWHGKLRIVLRDVAQLG